MSKYFIVGTPDRLSKDDVAELEQNKEDVYNDYWSRFLKRGQFNIEELPNIKAVPNRVIVAVDMNKKSTHRMECGTEIYLARQFDNFDRKYTEPVNAIVISGGGVPAYSEAIIHHNAIHDVNRIFNINGVESSESLRYFSVLEGQVYLYREKDSEQWKPCEGFATALRLFKPYTGIIEGIGPTRVKDKLYITSGELSGQVVLTLKAADYEMIFQGLNGREQRVIRIRHFGLNELHEREEVIGIDHECTEMVKKGTLYVGLNESDCIPLTNTNIY